MSKPEENQIYDLCCELFPINRSITGAGVRETLSILQRELPDLNIHEIPSGTNCFDWIIPDEWNIKDAYIIDPDGNKIIDFKENNLHVVGYSTPIDLTLSLDELKNKLYSLPDQPTAIPYITSYYERDWGFCISEEQKKNLKNGNYRVFIDSEFTNGVMNYGELFLEGNSTDEVFLSTYICHPSMANNELSGPAVTTHIAKHLQSIKNRRNSYRFIFIPETIGSIAYLSKNLDHLKENMIAGFNVTCVGDNNNFSYLPSRNEKTLADKVALHVLNHLKINYKKYSFLDRGSDERQYCYPGIDLPVASIMRSKYGSYDEYHTSLDDLSFISMEGLNGAYNVYIKAIESLELNQRFKNIVLCEPQLSKRGLYPSLSTKESNENVDTMMNLLTYIDGDSDLLSIAEKINKPIWELTEIIDSLKDSNLITSVDS